jgi:hypothetical protein
LLGNELHEAVLNKLVVKKFPAFYGMYWQEFMSRPYSEPIEFSSYSHIPYSNDTLT